MHDEYFVQARKLGRRVTLHALTLASSATVTAAREGEEHVSATGRQVTAVYMRALCPRACGRHNTPTQHCRAIRLPSKHGDAAGTFRTIGYHQ